MVIPNIEIVYTPNQVFDNVSKIKGQGLINRKMVEKRDLVL